MAGDNWELPTPIFRSSEGTNVIAAKVSPPVGVPEFDEPDTLSPDSDDNLSSMYAPPDDQMSEAPLVEPTVEVEEQPFISEQLTAERITPMMPETAKPAEKKGSSFVTVLLLLFLFLAALVAALYYVFFIRQPADTTF